MFNRIKELRKVLGLTQKEFGNRIGRGFRSIQNYEANIGEPDINTIKAICLTFGVNSDWLIKGNGEMFDKEIGEDRLSEEEKALLHYYNGLDSNDKKTIQNLISSLSKTDKKIV